MHEINGFDSFLSFYCDDYGAEAKLHASLSSLQSSTYMDSSPFPCFLVHAEFKNYFGLYTTESGCEWETKVIPHMRFSAVESI